jgi:metal-responsive CopG/Arc/MetJ family transcriptional regulator
MKQFDGRAERINITMPRRLLVKIDSFVSEHPQFSNRSAFWQRQHVECCLE